MTREEAIQYIDGLRCKEDFPYTDTIADFIKERNEAIDMAIEALENTEYIINLQKTYQQFVEMWGKLYEETAEKGERDEID